MNALSCRAGVFIAALSAAWEFHWISSETRESESASFARGPLLGFSPALFLSLPASNRVFFLIFLGIQKISVDLEAISELGVSFHGLQKKECSFWSPNNGVSQLIRALSHFTPSQRRESASLKLRASIYYYLSVEKTCANKFWVKWNLLIEFR